MLGTLLLVFILTQQCLDLIKDLVQVLGILVMNAKYNLTPIEHRDLTVNRTLLTSESSQQKNLGTLNGINILLVV
jgi:hypothetical protein